MSSDEDPEKKYKRIGRKEISSISTERKEAIEGLAKEYDGSWDREHDSVPTELLRELFAYHGLERETIAYVLDTSPSFVGTDVSRQRDLVRGYRDKVCLQRMINEGMSIVDISDRFDKKEQTVRNKIRKLGIDMVPIPEIATETSGQLDHFIDRAPVSDSQLTSIREVQNVLSEYGAPGVVSDSQADVPNELVDEIRADGSGKDEN